MFNFKEKIVVITGASSGLGKQMSKAFAKEGANVVINYCHHEEEALELKKEIEEEYNVEALVIKCDISNEEEVEKMVNDIVDQYGGIDILVNNASVCRDTLLMDKNIFLQNDHVDNIGIFLPKIVSLPPCFVT